jgi:hypothetical protein
MEMTSFLAGIAVGRMIAQRELDVDVSIRVLGKELLAVKVGQKTYTVDPKEALKIIQPEHLWETKPYYSGWRDELDQYYLERNI